MSKTCKECKGKGKIKKKECDTCHGFGWVECRCGSYCCKECNPASNEESTMLFPGCSFGKCND
jgi:DnaJ-class molecular chaperone